MEENLNLKKNNTPLKYMISIFEKRFRYFQKILSGRSLSEYFHFLNFSDLTIQHEKNFNKMNITFIFGRNLPFYDIGNLPLEISQYIYEYYKKEFCILSVQIIHGKYYPFKRPYWRLINVKNSSKKYYNKKILEHNLLYKKYWNVSIDILKDIEIFLSSLDKNVFMKN